jgi:SpoIID/LytB domain protein
MPGIKKITLLIIPLILLFAFVITNFSLQPVLASKCDDIKDLDKRYDCYKDEEASTSKKLSDVRKQKNDVSEKINNLLGQLNVTQSELNSLQYDINTLVQTLESINTTLLEKNDELEDKILFRNKVVRNYSKRGVLNDLEIFFSSNRTGDLNGFEYSTLTYMFEKVLNLETRRIIGALNTEIYNYERDKEEAEDLKNELVSAQAALIAAKNTLENERRLAQTDLNVLAEKESSYQQKLSEISSKQQEILAAKAGDDSGTVGDYDAPKWEVPKPPFKPAFGFFSYGAYTHYKGMSQYGAKGRAEDGDSYKDIIKYYYGEKVKEIDTPSKICVDGYGKIELQYYLYGLAEMPSGWPEDALMAQAIAGRTYALRYHDAGKCICTSQSCQVFLKSKADNPPKRWKDAVDDTEDMVIGGNTNAMYSSTTGGYLDESGWDVDGKWPNDAYEKKAKSPWFYWAWYSQNYRFDSSTCGLKHPWLDEDEMADILNSWVVWRKGNNKDRDRITPVTTSCWGGNPYSNKQMANRADELDKKYTSVSGVSTVIGNNGRTQSISFNTNHGKITIDGAEFRTVFNLRAPGYIALKSRLYDIQHER